MNSPFTANICADSSWVMAVAMQRLPSPSSGSSAEDSLVDGVHQRRGKSLDYGCAVILRRVESHATPAITSAALAYLVGRDREVRLPAHGHSASFDARL